MLIWYETVMIKQTFFCKIGQCPVFLFMDSYSNRLYRLPSHHAFLAGQRWLTLDMIFGLGRCPQLLFFSWFLDCFFPWCCLSWFVASAVLGSWSMWMLPGHLLRTRQRIRALCLDSGRWLFWVSGRRFRANFRQRPLWLRLRVLFSWIYFWHNAARFGPSGNSSVGI